MQYVAIKKVPELAWIRHWIYDEALTFDIRLSAGKLIRVEMSNDQALTKSGNETASTDMLRRILR